MPNEQKKILYVESGLDYFVTHRNSLADAAKKDGYDLSVTALYPDFTTDTSSVDAKVHLIAQNLPKIPIVNLLVLMNRFRKLTNQVRPDIIHLITLRSILFAGLVARIMGRTSFSSVTGLGVLFTEQKIYTPVLHFVLGLAFKFIFSGKNHQVLFQNPDDMALFINRKWVNPDKCILIRGSGVDTEQFPAVKVEQSVPTILFPSRLLKPKGILDFLKAVEIVAKKGLKFKALVVGKPDPENPSAISLDQINDYVEKGLVDYLGFQKNMVDVFSKATIVCMPSYYREGVPKVLIEAASCGRPIITADSPGCREIVDHGKTGLLVPPKSPEELAKAMEELLTDPKKCEKYGKAGRHMVIDGFSSEIVNAGILRQYKKLLE